MAIQSQPLRTPDRLVWKFATIGEDVEDLRCVIISLF
jgi:hypothetical protein